MEHKLIKTDNYLLVGSNDDLRRGWFYCVRKNDIFQDEGEDVHCCNGDIRITAHLPLNNSPILEGVDLLPPMEDDVEKLADKLISCSDFIDVLLVKEVWKSGYNKAKEKYKYTEEDIRFAIKSAFMQGVERVPYLHQLEDNIIKALQQPKMPVAFECEEHQELCLNCEWQHNSCPNAEDCLKSKPKTITTPQGQTVWGGNL